MGDRPKIDNWRRSASFNSIKNITQAQKEDPLGIGATIEDSNFITMETLLENIPLTPEKILQSNQKKYGAYSALGEIFKNKLDDCKESIYWNERLIVESSSTSILEQTYFDLAFCYKKVAFLN